MNVQFSDDDIKAKAAELGLMSKGADLPRHLRSRVVAALLQEAASAAPGQVASEPELANEIVIQPGGTILIDGEPFPWLVAKQAMEIGLDPGGISTVRLTLMTNSVQIIKPEPREESEQQ